MCSNETINSNHRRLTKMNLGKSGVWFPVNGLGKADAIKLAQMVEQLNYDTL